uniref:Ribosomal-protein-alanine N-acetyltransferase like n=1 Tax=Batrachospermum sp. TaxID=31373 RepID=A0A8K2AQN0_9FLOR|nr:ribosomal-protein-alanine N-acetyltransferase like [Batrachospermum sp.]
MLFFHLSTNNINYSINILLYRMKYDYFFTDNYILLSYSSVNIRILAILLVHDVNIIWLSNYQLTRLQSYSFIVILLYIISYHMQKKQIYLIETKIFNYKALSLYVWLGFNLIQQRNNYYYEEKTHGLNFFYNKSQSKNLWRRLLILTI